MPVYRVTFEGNRIGGDHDVGPAVVRADDYGDLAEAVYDLARPHLMSRSPEVIIDQRDDEDQPTGLIFAGFRTVGRFTVEEVGEAA